MAIDELNKPKPMWRRKHVGLKEILSSPVVPDLRMTTVWRNSLAVNAETGWLAVIEHVHTSGHWVTVLEPEQSTSFSRRATLKLPTIAWDVRTRIRFLGDYVYVFDFAQQHMHIIVMLKGAGIRAKTHTLQFVRTLSIAVFGRENRCIDAAVVVGAVVLLFNDFIGFWRARHQSRGGTCGWQLELPTVSAMCQPPRSCEPKLLEVSSFDDQNFVFLCTEPHQMEPARIVAVNPAWDGRRQCCSFVRAARPTFDKTLTVFCVSKHYGLFYTSDGDQLWQAPNPAVHNSESVLIKHKLPVRWLNKREQRFVINKLVYDESYGISGRLLIFHGTDCRDTFLPRIFEQFAHQMINMDEFRDVRRIISHMHRDVRRGAGFDVVHHNVEGLIYQMLFGADDHVWKLWRTPGSQMPKIEGLQVITQ